MAGTTSGRTLVGFRWSSGTAIYFDRSVGPTAAGNLLTITTDAVTIGDAAQSASFVLPDDTNLTLGTGSDYTIGYNLANTRLQILPAVANGAIWFGDGSTNPDIRIAGSDSTNNILIDSSEDQVRITGMTMEFQTSDKLLFRDTGVFIHSNADGKMTIGADGSGTDDITLSGTVTVSDDTVFQGELTYKDGHTQTLAGNKTLVAGSTRWQYLDPDNGGGRNITLPAVAASAGIEFRIVNTANAGEDLNVLDAAAATIAVISQNETGIIFSDGTTWGGGVLKAT